MEFGRVRFRSLPAGVHGKGVSDLIAKGLAGLPPSAMVALSVAAMLAVGFWSALSTRRVWLAPLAFANMLLVGALLGMSGIALPALEPMVAATVLALGLLVATRAQFPGAVSAALAGGFAVFHGMAHGIEVSGASPVAVLVGMVAGTAVLHGLGLAAGLALHARSVWWPRLAGAALALWGGALLAQLA